MFDDLRNVSEDGGLFEQPEGPAFETFAPPGGGRFLGMTAGRRFIIALLLLGVVVVLGLMCMLVTGRIWVV